MEDVCSEPSSPLSLGLLNLISSPVRWGQEQDPASRVNAPTDTRALFTDEEQSSREGEGFPAGHTAVNKASSHLRPGEDSDT